LGPKIKERDTHLLGDTLNIAEPSKKRYHELGS
jgi:hypothetical protein